MTLLLGIFIVLGVLGAALGAYALLAPKKTPAETSAVAPGDGPDVAPAQDDTAWTHEAGAEFAGLGEAARCDLIFAVAALGDDASERLLVHALDDPSETVALAAAHALARNGRLEAVRTYAQSHDGPRSVELLQLVSLLA